MQREPAADVGGEPDVDGAGLADQDVETRGDDVGSGLVLELGGQLAERVEPAVVALGAPAQARELGLGGRERRARLVLAARLDADDRDQRRLARLGREAVDDRARGDGRAARAGDAAAPGRVLDLDAGQRAREVLADDRAGAVSGDGREDLARRGRPFDPTQRSVGPDQAQRLRARDQRDRHRCAFHRRAERGLGRRVGHGGGARGGDRLPQWGARRGRVADRHDPRYVGDRVAARSRPDPHRLGEAVAPLPGTQPLARDARQLREAGRADRLPMRVHHAHVRRCCPSGGCPCVSTLRGVLQRRGWVPSPNRGERAGDIHWREHASHDGERRGRARPAASMALRERPCGA